MISMEPKNIYVKDKKDFRRVEHLLNGRVFWREKKDDISKVEIKIAFPSKYTRNIVKSLKD